MSSIVVVHVRLFINTILIVHRVALSKCTIIVHRTVCHRDLNEMSVFSSLSSCSTHPSSDY